jgi:hypothetical protein
MTLSGSNLIRLLESLRTADGVDTIRMQCQRILQELIEAEATEAKRAPHRWETYGLLTWKVRDSPGHKLGGLLGSGRAAEEATRS